MSIIPYFHSISTRTKKIMKMNRYQIKEWEQKDCTHQYAATKQDRTQSWNCKWQYEKERQTEDQTKGKPLAKPFEWERNLDKP